jgi:predicted permease
MGASRRSVLLQLCTEGLLLALLGGATGLAVAYWSTTVLVRSLAGLAPVDLVFAAGPDLRVLAATMTFCLLSTLLFSFGPAWSLSRPDVFTDLKGKEQESSGRGRRGLFSRRNLLVVGQLALSLMLLTAAGLFIKSALQAARMAPGFQVDDGLVIEVDPSLAGYDKAHTKELYRALLPRLRAVPGVASADLAATVPFGMVSLGRGVQRASDPPLSKADASSDSRKRAGVVEASFNIVGEDYFKTLGVAVLRGRAFESRETSGAGSPVVILDKLAAEALFPKADPIGQRVRMIGDGLDAAGEAEVVGVVGSVQQHILGTAWSPHLYVPFGQEVQSDMTLHVRAMASGKDAQAALLDAVRREIRAVDPRLPVLAARSLGEHLEGSFDLWLARTAARMFTLFGGVALLLAVIGLYGVRAYAVARRTREIGIRMAIGASAGDALRLIFRVGAALTALGLGGGLVLSIALGKLLSGMLYQVSGLDPLVLAAAPATLAAVSLLACWIPARKAALTDPMVALRDE